MFKFIVDVLKWFFMELAKAYEATKKFVVQVLGVFKGPPTFNSGGTLIAQGKVSAKRVWAAALFVVFMRQLFMNDKWGALMAVTAAGILMLIAAITKT